MTHGPFPRRQPEQRRTVSDSAGSRRNALLLRLAFFAGVMGCGYLILYIGLPPRGRAGRDRLTPSERDLRERLCEGVEIVPGRWRTIVVHHSATPGGNAARFDDYHRYTLGWEGGLGYHFVIGNGHGSGDGEIEIGHRWRRQQTGAHVRGHNAGAIGICLVGNFDERLPAGPTTTVADTEPTTRAAGIGVKSEPTQRQMRALISLVRCLMDLCHIEPSGVLLHRQLGQTDCPGRFFPEAAFRAALDAPRSPREAD